MWRRWGKGVGRWGGRGGGGGRGRLYTYRCTVTTRITPGLRWAVMRAVLMFHSCEGQSHKTVSTDHNFWRERRAEEDLNQSPWKESRRRFEPKSLCLPAWCFTTRPYQLTKANYGLSSKETGQLACFKWVPYWGCPLEPGWGHSMWY